MHHSEFKDIISTTIAAPVAGHCSKQFIHTLKNCRRVCRTWKRRVRPIDQRENDTKILIDALDLLEETRCLTSAEASLRRLAVHGLQAIHSEKLAY